MTESSRGMSSVKAAELLDQQLNEISSVFARLVFLASRRAPGGYYVNPELTHLTSRAVCQRLMREAHRRAFRSWLSLDLENKIQDMKHYLKVVHPRESLSDARETWEKLLRDLVPLNASPTESYLFLGTSSTVLKSAFRGRR